MRVLGHRDFRLLFGGQAASALGDQITFVALALFITRRTGSATDLGLVLFAQSLPMIALLLLGGVWADRLPRHQIMIACDVARMALHGLLAALVFTGAVRVWQIIAIEALFGVARAFFQPAYTGLLPQTVPEHLVQASRALTDTAANLSVVIGPALATGLVLGAGAGWAFAVDAATFLVSAVLLVPVRPRPRGDAAVLGESVPAALRAGYREVRSRPWVWVTIVAYTGIVFCVYAQWNALAPIVAREAYGSVGVFGVLEALSGAGAVVAALVGLVWRPRRPLFAGLILGLLWPVQSIVYAVVAPRGLLYPLVLVTGFGFGLMLIWWETALAHHIPPHALSRVSSYDWMGSLALMPVGFAVAGPLAGAFGARNVLAVGGVIGLALTLMALLPRSTRGLASPQQLAREVGVELGGEA